MREQELKTHSIDCGTDEATEFARGSRTIGYACDGFEL